MITAYRLKHKHKWFDDYVSIGFQKWRNAIGTSKQQQKLIRWVKDSFFVTPNRDDYPDYSHKDGITIAYALNSQTRAAIEAMDKQIRKPAITTVTDVNGKPARENITAIDRRKSGGLSLPHIPGWCPVNMTALAETLKAVTAHLESLDGWRANPPKVLEQELKAITDKIYRTGENSRHANERRYRQYLTRVVNEINDILGMASGKHYGLIPQRFNPSPAGRFYAAGLNLQNCSRMTRNAALSGCYSFDIESCHHAIMLHIAEQHNLPCAHLRYYVENKKKLRIELADVLGSSKHVSVVKEALIAMIYGAKKNEHFGTLKETLGAAGYAAMFAHPRFAGLFDELEAITNAVVDNAPRQAKTHHVVNVLGQIDGTATTVKEQAAHLLQGIESQALQAALNVHSSAIMPLHDGWLCVKPESHTEAEQAILKNTGMALQIGKPEKLKLSGISG